MAACCFSVPGEEHLDALVLYHVLLPAYGPNTVGTSLTKAEAEAYVQLSEGQFCSPTGCRGKEGDKKTNGKNLPIHTLKNAMNKKKISIVGKKFTVLLG